MSEIEPASYSAAPGKYYPLVLCFFVGSGLAALIYDMAASDNHRSRIGGVTPPR